MVKAAVLREDGGDDSARLVLTGQERTFAINDIIVSKTDPRGVMEYVNNVFIDISGYQEKDLIGKPHSLIRHPHMPRCVFKLLWDTLKGGHEIFAYVVNRCINGDHYWVMAHATPTFGPGGEIVGYHSCRRVPRREAVDVIQPIYKALLAEEQKHGSRAGMEASTKMLMDTLAAKGVSYDKFVLSL